MITSSLTIQLPPLKQEEVAKQFPGPLTAKRLAAIRRMLAKTQTLTIPRHLSQKFWEMTGGWVKPLEVELATPYHTQFVLKDPKILGLGDLKVVRGQQEWGSSEIVFFFYRGLLASVKTKWNNPHHKRSSYSNRWESGDESIWRSQEKVKLLWTVANSLSAEQAISLGLKVKS